MGNLSCIRTYLNMPEADIAKSVLEASGIEAVISADDCGGWRAHMSFGMRGIRLLVKEEEAQKAIEVLESSSEIEGAK